MKPVMFDIYEVVEEHGRGDPADDSETWKVKRRFYVVDVREKEEYCQSMSENYADQDYSYKFDFKQILGNVTREELEQFKEEIEEELNK